MNDYSLHWSKNSEKSLAAVVSYLAERNAPAADRWLAKLEKSVELLKVTPGLGVRVSGYSDVEVREFVVGRYRIFYEVHHELLSVRVMLIWHGARRHPDRKDLGLDSD